MKFDTMINLALAAIVFKFVYDVKKAIDDGFGFGDRINENIVSNKNAVYTSANDLLEGITGVKNRTLGTAIYDWMN